MMLKKKKVDTNEVKLKNREEKITKKRALELFDLKMDSKLEDGTFDCLAAIHKYIFGDIYDFAGEIRKENIAKGNFRFVSSMYLEEVLEKISKMPENTFNEILEKYIEMNIAHPFREGNGRSTRIWINMILKKNLNKVIDWSKVNKEDYLFAIERSPIRSTELKMILENALTDKINDRNVYMKSIDASYDYEGYNAYLTKEL